MRENSREKIRKLARGEIINFFGSRPTSLLVSRRDSAAGRGRRRRHTHRRSSAPRRVQLY